MRLSSVDLETTRKQPQQTKLHLSIFQPTVVMKARVNNVDATKGDREIIYDSSSIGTFASVEAGMTMLVGSADGLSDIGKIRIRSATSSQFVVSENSNIEWDDNQFLTVLKLWELWPIFPRIISDPADPENVIFYKDYDIPYSNQNSVLGTYVNAGPHRATFRDCASGQARLYYGSTGTHNLLGDSLVYNWTFEGGSPSSSTSANPGYVTYSTPGHYVSRLQISGSSGAVDTTYRYASVYDHPSCGTGTVPTSWEMTSFDGSRSEGGYNAKFKVRQNVTVTEGSVVVIFSEDWYGDTKQSFGGNFPNSSEIFFVGYVMNDTIRHNYKDSYVEFEASSLTGLMKNAIGFSVSVESKANPTKWYELAELDCRRAIYHYLKWHTTALSISDFQFVGTDQLLQFFDADRSSMYDAIDNLMRGTLIGSLVSDRQGKMWAEVDAQAYTDPVTSFSPVMTITKRDWMNDPAIEERLSDETSYLELGGIAYDGNAASTFAALMASAPGNAPGFRGKIDRRQGLALTDQAQLNQLVGNMWANDNSRYPTINMEMAVSARNLDIAPQETAQMSVLASDTARGVAINGLYVPESFNWRFDAKTGVLRPTIGYRNLVTGNLGETIDIPHAPADGGFDSGFSVPGLQIPPLPIFIPGLVAGADTTATITNVINSYLGHYAVRTRNFSTQVHSAARGMTIAVSTSATTGLIQLTVDGANQLGGYYLCIATLSVRDGSLTPGTSVNGGFSLSSSAGAFDTDVEYRGVADNNGDAVMGATAATIFRLPIGNGVSFSWLNVGSAFSGDDYAYNFAAVRISGL